MGKKIDQDLLNTTSALSSLEKHDEHVTSNDGRRERPPRQFDDKQGPLAFPEIPGYRTYVADYSGNVYDFQYLKLLDKGYVPVLRKEIDPTMVNKDSHLSESEVIFSTGHGTRGILLKIPQEWWDEDYDKQVKDNNSRVRNKINAEQAIAESEAGGELRADPKSQLTIKTTFGKI